MEETQKLKQELHRKDLEIKELKSLATKDPLTGLSNRRGFEEEVSRLIKDIIFAKENPETRKHFYIDSISILFFDIDNFKKLNDTYGHKIGDQILQQVSQIIRQKVRNIDFIARWGGEELVAALVGSHEGDAFRKAEEIRKAIKSRVKINEKKITVSVGVAELKEGFGFEDLIKQADKAMYEAKHNRGKDNAVRYSELNS
ncbi:MAG: diguanylate cyclase [Parcubacteria group bacterium Gr01-1014_2]|nr:MAG: diguanylate cyclase [Parcubacteria group bacterium Gr01-1014_2]